MVRFLFAKYICSNFPFSIIPKTNRKHKGSIKDLEYYGKRILRTK